MGIINRPAFRYSGHDAENIRRAIQFVSNHVRALSMGDLRLLVCKASGGSYAELSRYLRLRERDDITLGYEQAQIHYDVIQTIETQISQASLRMLITWSRCLIRDLEQLDNESLEAVDLESEEQRAMA